MRFLQLLLNKNCPHENVRCVHGDEINHLNGKRAACRDCPQLFDVLPIICSVTNKPH